MSNIPNPRKKVSAEAIAKQADWGQSVSSYFTNKGRMVSPVKSVNVDFAHDMLQELDAVARELNVSRQADIKVLSDRPLISTTFPKKLGA